MKYYLYIFIALLLFYSCNSTYKIHYEYKEENNNKYLKFYKDSTFLYYMNSPCFDVFLGQGKYNVANDTLNLIYEHALSDTIISKKINIGKSTWKDNNLTVKIDTIINTSVEYRNLPIKIELHRKKIFVYFNNNGNNYRIFYKN